MQKSRVFSSLVNGGCSTMVCVAVAISLLELLFSACRKRPRKRLEEVFH